MGYKTKLPLNDLKRAKDLLSEHLMALQNKSYGLSAQTAINFVVFQDICPMAELKVFNKEINSYELCYKNGFPPFEIVKFCDLNLPLLSKAEIIKDKEKLVWQRESDRKDIEGLKQLIAAQPNKR